MPTLFRACRWRVLVVAWEHLTRGQLLQDGSSGLTFTSHVRACRYYVGKSQGEWVRNWMPIKIYPHSGSFYPSPMLMLRPHAPA